MAGLDIDTLNTELKVKLVYLHVGIPPLWVD